MPKTVGPLILGLITDLFFSPRLASTAERMGYGVELIESAVDLETPGDFLERLKAERSALIVLDLNSALPWAEWLAAAKADPGLVGIPWLAFGSHKDVETMARATKLGADNVVAKSRFSSVMPDLIQALLQK